jgi:FixJ family two-component response regulator
LQSVPQGRGCVIFEVGLDHPDSLEQQLRALKARTSFPIIVSDPSADVSRAVQAMKVGAQDFLASPTDKEIVVAAINEAVSVFDRYRRIEEAAAKIGSLSPRERQVLEALAEGRTMKGIAEELGLSVRTVEVHRVRAFRRLGVRNLSHAIVLYVMARQKSV